MTDPRTDPSGSRQSAGAEPYVDTWVVLPTYNEAENVERIGRALVVVLQLRFDELRGRGPAQRGRRHSQLD